MGQGRSRAVHCRWRMSDQQRQGRQCRDGDWVGPVQGERHVICGGTTRGRDHPIRAHNDEGSEVLEVPAVNGGWTALLDKGHATGGEE
jgi:hypothetical protein